MVYQFRRLEIEVIICRVYNLLTSILLGHFCIKDQKIVNKQHQYILLMQE